ncbi:hypothetical protein FRB90_001638 [Tulasnella sp. 427]|nr:hypothetical protein FRB90_001638 [Tulasnella sp. 427]
MLAWQVHATRSRITGALSRKEAPTTERNVTETLNQNEDGTILEFVKLSAPPVHTLSAFCQDALFQPRFIIPALLSLGVDTIAIPNPTGGPDLAPRCDACASGPGIGNGIGSSIHTSVDVDATLRLFSNDQLTFTSNVAEIFVLTTGDVKSQVNSALTIGSGVLGWTTGEVTELAAALDRYIAGTVTNGVNIFAKARIDAVTFTVTEAAYLKAFIASVVQSHVQLSREVKADLVLFVRNAVVLANVTCSDLRTRIRNNVSVFTSAIDAFHLDAKVATCASAAQASKQVLNTYIQSAIASATGLSAAVTKVTLTTLLQIVNAWISNDFGVLSGTAVTLLGIDLKAAPDAAICKAIVGYLLSVNARFNFVIVYGLDAGLYAKVFSTAVGN